MKERYCETCGHQIRANNLAICRRCEEELRRRLGNQAAHCSELETEYLRQTRKAETIRRGGFSFPILYEAQARRLLDRQLRLLKTWVSAVVERRSNLRVPHGCTVPILGGWLAGNLSALRRNTKAAEILRDIRLLDQDIFTLIDLPATRTKVHVGPCPNSWPVEESGQTRLEHCPGQIDAYVPADETAPAYMRCDACAAQWPSRYWSDVGEDINARASEIQRRNDLAKSLARYA